jgi:type VI secretion system protein ImpF
MSDNVPIERLQPCLLDRLTDDEPLKKEESRSQRIISHQKYRRGVMRDIEWLFNSSSYVRVPGRDDLDLRDYPEAWRSVINFGTRQLCGLAAPDMQRLQKELAEAIRFFEPRLSTRGLKIHANAEKNMITFEIEGELWANPLPENLHLKTTVDLETGRCLLGDATNG